MTARLFDVVCDLVWDDSLMSNPDGHKAPGGRTTTAPTVVEVWAESHELAVRTVQLARSYRIGFDGWKLIPVGAYASDPAARWNPGAHNPTTDKVGGTNA